MTHEERMALIMRPFFIERFGPSYPWGGTAVADNFYGTGDWAERPRPTQSETGTSRGTGHSLISQDSRHAFSVIDPLATAVAKAQEII